MTNIAESSGNLAVGEVINSPKRVIGRPFVKGVVTNPGGRPKGLAAYVREATGDGKRAVDIAVALMLGDNSVTMGGVKQISPELQLDAAKWLMDRGYGRSVNPVEITGLDGGPIQRLDLTILAAADLDQLESILSKSAHGNANSVDSGPESKEFRHDGPESTE